MARDQLAALGVLDAAAAELVRRIAGDDVEAAEGQHAPEVAQVGMMHRDGVTKLIFLDAPLRQSAGVLLDFDSVDFQLRVLAVPEQGNGAAARAEIGVFFMSLLQ